MGYLDAAGALLSCARIVRSGQEDTAMTELRTDLAGDFVDATVASSCDELPHAPAVAVHGRLSRSAYGVLAVALFHGVRSVRRPVVPDAVAGTN
jgi:hypothetical protein